MFGLVVGLIILIYLALAVLTFWLVRRSAIKRKWSKCNRRLGLLLVVFTFYMIPFWDLAPTLIAHKYYCESEAGLFVYKDPEQWSRENPDVLDKLTPYPDSVRYKSRYGRGKKLNDRFASVSQFTENIFLSIKKYESQFIDIETGEILAKRIMFFRGYGSISSGKKGSWKFWLKSNYCFSREKSVKHAEQLVALYRKFNAKGD